MAVLALKTQLSPPLHLPSEFQYGWFTLDFPEHCLQLISYFLKNAQMQTMELASLLTEAICTPLPPPQLYGPGLQRARCGLTYSGRRKTKRAFARAATRQSKRIQSTDLPPLFPSMTQKRNAHWLEV